MKQNKVRIYTTQRSTRLDLGHYNFKTIILCFELQLQNIIYGRNYNSISRFFLLFKTGMLFFKTKHRSIVF